MTFRPKIQKSPALRGGQKASKEVKVLLTEDEFEALRGTGKTCSAALREAAQALAMAKAEDRFGSRFQAMERSVESAARDARKCHDRLDGLYAQSRAQEASIKGEISDFRGAISAVFEAITASQMALERQIQALDQRQRILFSLLTAVAHSTANDDALRAIRGHFRRLSEDSGADPAMALYEHLVKQGERVVAQNQGQK